VPAVLSNQYDARQPVWPFLGQWMRRWRGGLLRWRSVKGEAPLFASQPSSSLPMVTQFDVDRGRGVAIEIQLSASPEVRISEFGYIFIRSNLIYMGYIVLMKTCKVSSLRHVKCLH